MEQKRCDGCGASFGCGSAEGRCWCAGLPQVLPLPDAGKDCLCPACLEREVAGRIRIVSLLPAATDILHAVGAGDRLVGVSHLCEAPAQVPRVLSTPIDSERWDMKRINEEVRRLGRTGEPMYVVDEARVTGLRPDVIFTQGLCPVCAAGPETVKGVPVPRLVTLTPHSLEDVAKDIETVGAAVGRSEAGRTVAAEFRDRIARVRSACAARSPKPKVTVVEWYAPPWVSGEWIPEMVEAAGGVYVPLKPGEGSRPATWEELHAADPDIVVLAPCSMTAERAKREMPLLEEQSPWGELRAVREGRVAVMDGAAHFSASGPRLAEGVEALRDVIGSFR